MSLRRATRHRTVSDLSRWRRFRTPLRVSVSLLGCVLLLAGCVTSAVTPELAQPQLPERWGEVAEPGAVQDDWLLDMDDGALSELVTRALGRNYQLGQLQAEVEAARAAHLISGAARYPELTLNFDAARRRIVGNEFGTRPAASNFEAGLGGRWELDVWGRLKDLEKQALLRLSATRASYQDGRHRLAAQVANAWFDAVGAQELLSLLRERLRNLEADLEIITRSYNQGLRGALDVYLARTSVAQEQARIIGQRQHFTERRLALQLLLGDYPDGTQAVAASLPALPGPAPAGVPSELIARRPDLQQAWLNLLASDAGVAAAHKQRFPRISLAAAGSDVSPELTKLLNGSALAWSMLGNIALPLFNKGRLKAQEQQARARLEQMEQRYLERLYQAFSEVENALGRDHTLAARYEVAREAQANAEAALTLASEQYQRGLVPYTTVLEAQRRAFDIQSELINLHRQRLQNRVGLHLALGGGFSEQ